MTYLIAIAGIAALIIIHEFGHFIAAKAVGMRVERFSLFFGPLLVKVRRGETEYGIGPIPLGGYVKISGMNPNEEFAEEAAAMAGLSVALRLVAQSGTGVVDGALLAAIPTILSRAIDSGEHALVTMDRAYYRQPVWKRVVVILAGPFMNLLLAFVILTGLVLSQGLLVTRHGQDVATRRVAPGSLIAPASHYLQGGDEIVSVDGRRGLTVNQIANSIASHHCAGTPTAGCRATSPVTITVRRDGALHTFSMYPVYDAGLKKTRIGFGFAFAVRHYGVVGAAGQGLSQMWYVTHETVSRVVQIFKPKERKQLHGIVGVTDLAQQAVALGPAAALDILALISLSLAIINLFPFLPLDGGHVFWALAEKVRGRPIPFSVMERAGVVGFVLVILIGFIGLSNDISSLTGSGLTLR
jgi:regulator of sigma E protease